MAIERRSRRLAMLVALAGGGLLSTATTVGITPFLLDIAHDFGTDLAAAGNLVALQSVTWGIASLFGFGVLGAVLSLASHLVPRQGARLVVAGTER